MIEENWIMAKTEINVRNEISLYLCVVMFRICIMCIQNFLLVLKQQKCLPAYRVHYQSASWRLRTTFWSTLTIAPIYLLRKISSICCVNTTRQSMSKLKSVLHFHERTFYEAELFVYILVSHLVLLQVRFICYRKKTPLSSYILFI